MDNKLTETGSSNRRVAAVPIWVKPYLTIEEAAEYTGIGRDKLYEMTSLADCPFVLWVGNRRMIKRRIFDEYIEQMYSEIFAVQHPCSEQLAALRCLGFHFRRNHYGSRTYTRGLYFSKTINNAFLN